MKFGYAVLAGGKGTRMGDLTKLTNKCMLPYKGKPIIGHIIDGFIDIGAKEVTLTVNHAKKGIISYLESSYPNIHFNFIHDPLEGTGKSVDALKEIDCDYLLIMMADQIIETKVIRNMISKFKDKPSNYILSEYVENPERYGVLKIKGNQVLGIIEKPKAPPSNLINRAVYIFDRTIFSYTSNLRKSKRGEYEVVDAIQASIDSGNEFRHVLCGTKVLDFTSPKDLKQ